MERHVCKSSARENFSKAAIIAGLLCENRSPGAAGQVEVSSRSSYTGRNVVRERRKSVAGVTKQLRQRPESEKERYRGQGRLQELERDVAMSEKSS